MKQHTELFFLFVACWSFFKLSGEDTAIKMGYTYDDVHVWSKDYQAMKNENGWPIEVFDRETNKYKGLLVSGEPLDEIINSILLKP